MKTKFTLFVILIFTIACSPDVSGLFDMEIGDETFFSPSVWIQCVWVDEYFNINYKNF